MNSDNKYKVRVYMCVSVCVCVRGMLVGLIACDLFNMVYKFQRTEHITPLTSMKFKDSSPVDIYTCRNS